MRHSYSRLFSQDIERLASNADSDGRQGEGEREGPARSAQGKALWRPKPGAGATWRSIVSPGVAAGHGICAWNAPRGRAYDRDSSGKPSIEYELLETVEETKK